VQQIEHSGESIAFVFPGQGSQQPGMGKLVYDASPAARAVFDQADAILGRSISDLCFTAPADVLEDTANAQPAILTVSIATLEAIRERAESEGRTIVPRVVAGHSLGEFTAMVAAGVLDFPTALRLVQERGTLMREAGEERPGGMAAVIGLDGATLYEVCRSAEDHGIVTVANDNCPGQLVISGEIRALTRAMELATAQGARKVLRLGVSIASHSPLMGRVSAQLGVLISRVPLRTPQIPIVANITGQVITSLDEIRHELSMQVEKPVNWTRSVGEMINGGATTFVEIGPGQVLSGLIRRISKDVRVLPGQELVTDKAPR
jgi:[acyl-carrier-protein] S-malonyltransferase